MSANTQAEQIIAALLEVAYRAYTSLDAALDVAKRNGSTTVRPFRFIEEEPS